MYMDDQDIKIVKMPGFEAKEFLLPSSNVNLAEITLTARYPEEGFVSNGKSEMTAYILKGNVVLACAGENRELAAGTAVVIPVGKRYAWQPDAEVTMLIFSAPSWSPDQQEHHAGLILA
jgi:mannose-6-phosphate isomerase-like protein (cupin superfamily)